MRKIILALSAILTFTVSAYAEEGVFPVSTIDGKMLTFKGTPDGIVTSPYQGKIVFVEFWGTWCGPCLLSIPHHVKLQEKYKDQLKIIAIETTPNVTKAELLKYVADPATHIDMKRVAFYLNEKAKTKAQKDSLEGPIKHLEEFKAAKTKINYDVVASADAGGLIDYIAQRADWKGYIPFLLVLDGDGKAAAMVPGMPSEAKLEGIIQEILAKKK